MTGFLNTTLIKIFFLELKSSLLDYNAKTGAYINKAINRPAS